MTFKEWKITRAAELGVTTVWISALIRRGLEIVPSEFNTIRCVGCGAEIARRKNRKRCDPCAVKAKAESRRFWRKEKRIRCECGQGWKSNNAYGCDACNAAYDAAHAPRPEPIPEDDFMSQGWVVFAEAWKRLERLRMGGLRRRFNQFDRAL